MDTRPQSRIPLLLNCDSKNTLLLDNSTFFSSQVAVTEATINPSALFNLATLVESLILADTVYLSPTLAWKPDQTDPLFATNGPLKCIRAEEWTSDQAYSVLSAAIEEGLRDIAEHRDVLPFSNCDTSQTIRVLHDWAQRVEKDPVDMLAQYSGVVHWSDGNSLKVLDGIASRVGNSEPLHMHLAQYLFRTNVAYLLSGEVPYQPHSHRVSLVCRKSAQAHKSNLNLATSLLKSAEYEISKHITKPRFLSLFGAFHQMEPEMPMALSVVLAGSQSPSDVFKRALELRQTREAVRYRKWIGKLLVAANSNVYDTQLEAEHELQEAIADLTRELQRLYGDPQRLVTRARRMTGNLDAGSIPTDISVGSGVTMIRSLTRWLGRVSLRRRFAVILTFAHRRRATQTLNDLLPRVFGKKLNTDGVSEFYSIARDQQEKLNLLSKVGEP